MELYWEQAPYHWTPIFYRWKIPSYPKILLNAPATHFASFLPVVSTLENPTPKTNWYNSSPDDAHQKESLAHRWFKYPSGHWGGKFHYGCLFTLPPAKPALVRPYASFYLLTYVVGYYLLDWFSSMFGKFAYLGHLGHLAMVTVPIGLVIAGFNLGALAHQLGNLFPAKWVPDTDSHMTSNIFDPTLVPATAHTVYKPKILSNKITLLL
ncbi:hypothetical protein DSO57_1012001 [Entomophthora muscae]|uniref:Uncharacterized protein n=1 Tax=Entomophthora muscae TaxID=34485 RepID=A0ACC2UF18_9FUNG|nr:hypothetical protein DSO57_1012001 [Entomophthora muscae]